MFPLDPGYRTYFAFIFFALAIFLNLWSHCIRESEYRATSEILRTVIKFMNIQHILEKAKRSAVFTRLKVLNVLKLQHQAIVICMINDKPWQDPPQSKSLSWPRKSPMPHKTKGTIINRDIFQPYSPKRPTVSWLRKKKIYKIKSVRWMLKIVFTRWDQCV